MAAISVRSKIQRHFFCTPIDQLVSTRDLLIHGKRAGVDRAVWRLIKAQIIQRVAWGVFLRVGGRWPTVEQIAVFKAKAFGKEIRKDGLNSNVDFKLEPERLRNWKSTYWIDGGNSSIWHVNGRIYYKGKSRKRLYMEDNPTGLAVRAVWARGKDRLSAKIMTMPQMPWNRSREGINITLMSRRWMPAWLADCFQSSAYLGPERSKPSLIATPT